MAQFLFGGAIDPDPICCVEAIDLGDDLPPTEPLPPGYPCDTHLYPSRRPLRILILGDERDVTTTIGILQQRGFAQRAEWSRPIPCQQAIESICNLLVNMPETTVMGLLTRYFTD